MEKHLRSKIDKSYGTLKSHSTVTAISEDADYVYVDYKHENGDEHRIRGKFLVGADGKTGFVRKKYLEPRGVLLEKSNRQAPRNYERECVVACHSNLLVYRQIPLRGCVGSSQLAYHTAYT